VRVAESGGPGQPRARHRRSVPGSAHDPGRRRAAHGGLRADLRHRARAVLADARVGQAATLRRNAAAGFHGRVAHETSRTDGANDDIDGSHHGPAGTAVPDAFTMARGTVARTET